MCWGPPEGRARSASSNASAVVAEGQRCDRLSRSAAATVAARRGSRGSGRETRAAIRDPRRRPRPRPGPFGTSRHARAHDGTRVGHDLLLPTNARPGVPASRSSRHSPRRRARRETRRDVLTPPAASTLGASRRHHARPPAVTRPWRSRSTERGRAPLGGADGGGGGGTFPCKLVSAAIAPQQGPDPSPASARAVSHR